MIRDESGRLVIHCDRCPVRLDLGVTQIVQMRLRMPSGWIQDEPDHHLCPACSRRAVSEMVAARRDPTVEEPPASA